MTYYFQPWAPLSPPPCKMRSWRRTPVGSLSWARSRCWCLDNPPIHGRPLNTPIHGRQDRGRIKRAAVYYNLLFGYPPPCTAVILVLPHTSLPILPLESTASRASGRTCVSRACSFPHAAHVEKEGGREAWIRLNEPSNKFTYRINNYTWYQFFLRPKN